MKLYYCLFILFYFITEHANANLKSNDSSINNTKARVFILTDISNEPGDEESLVRFLLYANQYHVEGIVPSTSQYFKTGIREDIVRKYIDACGQIRNNLLIHEKYFSSKEQLLAVVASGQPGHGMEAVGKGRSSAGSALLFAAAKNTGIRPLWVAFGVGPIHLHKL